VSQMRDSAKSAEWVAKVVAENPIRKILNPQTGQWDGNILTCPVRLSFFDNSLHKMVYGKNDDGSTKTNGGFEVQILFPPCATPQVDSVLRPLVRELEFASFPKNFGPDGNSFGLHSPFRNQAEKQNYAGFTPGGILIRAQTQYKPPVVDSANNPIVDESRAYPGVWALVSVNLFHYPKNAGNFKGKRGVNFGLQAVMIIADDNKLGGGAGVDTKTQFAGVKIDAAFDPASAFGQPVAPPAPALSSAQSALI
jgi:hypothetical protein